MPRQFDVPSFYRSARLTAMKNTRRTGDPRKRDLSPTIIDCGSIKFKIARHFGFCFGVENAIEIAYKTILENPGKRIFLLSEMIHNPEVNADLLRQGVKFLMDTHGNRLVSFSELTPDDVVIVPAFGTTIELQNELEDIGIKPYFHDATCPFVEKVWKRAEELGRAGFTVIVHGKRKHEETRATFSHSKQTAPTLIIRDLTETKLIVDFIFERISEDQFNLHFKEAYSNGFNPKLHLQKIGVVNQTTMLASETQEISEYLRQALADKYGKEQIALHFADTRDTLCYATYENQTATKALIEAGADLAIVVGGYNSSNTSHLVELLEAAMPTFYIKNAAEILNKTTIRHFNLASKSVKITEGWLPSHSKKSPVEIAVTSGASCPDQIVDEVIQRILECGSETVSLEAAFAEFVKSSQTNNENLLPISS